MKFPKMNRVCHEGVTRAHVSPWSRYQGLGLWLARLFLSLLCGLAFSQTKRSEEVFGADAGGYVGNEACAKCHGSIYRSYMKTAMAQASGLASEERFVAGSFTHQPSGIKYEIYRSDEKTWLSFERPGDPMVRGKRELLYYIGQGRRGRTYLFSVDGFAFEAPVNWYSDRQMWDMPPAYSNTREIPMNLPALMSCLECHGSGIQPPVAGTENRYKVPIFSYPGVTCERCHGPGKAHTTGAPIINPAKLNAKRRDQVCMQCHLEGNVAIERTGRHLYEYKPGDDLFQNVRYFVLSDSDPERLRATSQFEALAQSMCKKKSGDRLSCTTCHDPHQIVSPEERVSFYRRKCLACHGDKFAAKHYRDQRDCTGCHMPESLSSDIAHTEVTDHRLLRRPQQALHTRTTQAFPQLVAFPPSEKAEQDMRDLALAWQATVNSGMTSAQNLAEQSLRAALKHSPTDPALLSSLAYVEQRRGADHEARRLYGEALKSDPDSIDAATNLGVLEAKEGHLNEAVKLWQLAFGRAPGRSEIGMNLGRSLCAVGRYDQARDDVMRVLQFNPDLDIAKQLLRHLDKVPPDCGL